jgi:hypothetical protein
MEWVLPFRNACKLEDVWFSSEAVCPVIIVKAEEPYHRVKKEVGAEQLGELLKGFGIWFAQAFESCGFHGLILVMGRRREEGIDGERGESETSDLS